MSLVVVHLRWDDVAPEQFHHIRRIIPPGRGFPAGCCSRQLRLEGRALLGTEVWADDGSAGRYLDGLPARVADAGLEPPQIVIFSLPAPYAAVYVRAAEALDREAAERDAADRESAQMSVPHPRAAAEQPESVPSGTA
jgi:hypothetical protein